MWYRINEFEMINLEKTSKMYSADTFGGVSGYYVVFTVDGNEVAQTLISEEQQKNAWDFLISLLNPS